MTDFVLAVPVVETGFTDALITTAASACGEEASVWEVGETETTGGLFGAATVDPSFQCFP